MVTKTIEIEVIDGDVTKATTNVDNLGKSISKVEKETKSTGDSISDAFDGAESSASNLEGGVTGVVSEVGKLTKAAKTGGKAMRTAFISTGIGALIIALGFVIDNWKTITDFISGANKELERNIQLNKDNLDNLDHELDLLNTKEKILKLEGKSTAEIKKQKQQIILLQQEENALLIENLKVQLERERNLVKEVTTWDKIKIATLEAFGAYEKAGEARAKAIVGDEDERERLRELEEGLQSSILRAEKLKLALLEVNQPTKQKRDKFKALDDVGVGISDPFNEQKELDARRAEALREGTEELSEIENERINLEIAALEKSAAIGVRKTEQEKEQSDARKRIAEEEAAAKELLLDGTSNALAAASELAGRETGAGKALAVAASLINTYSAITGQLKAFAGVPVPGYAIAQAVATGLAGFAAVKNILKVKVPNDKGSGASVGGIGSGGGASAPAFNVVGNSGVNQLAQSLNNDDQPVRAYVVGQDVTSQQEFDRTVEQNSTI